MLWSKMFAPMTRNVPKEAVSLSHQLMLKSGIIDQVMAGVYTYLPLGLKVMRRIENIVREEMDSIGGQEILMPVIQPLELWETTGRVTTMADILIKTRAMTGFETGWTTRAVLGPTHEEIVTALAASKITSHKQLTTILYQIQTKFRDEPRPQGGLIRTREFIMKDAYSFHGDADGLNDTYQSMRGAYEMIMRRCGVKAEIKSADSGAIGGDQSEEFVVGDLEVGHIFKLGDKYSSLLKAQFTGSDNTRHNLLMGCYGIGIGRLMAAVMEQSNDANGIIWPAGIAPYDVVVTLLDQDDGEVMRVCQRLQIILKGLSVGKGLSVLIDDRKERGGVKFAEADMLGIPARITIGSKGISAETPTIELKSRKTGIVKTVALDNNVAGEINNWLIDVILKRE